MATETEEEKKTGIADYLQAPKKKRKSYIVLALSKKIEPELYNGITQHLKKNFSSFAIMRVKNETELVRLLNRQIGLLCIDDEFMGLEENLKFIKELRIKKNDERLPVLFFTEQEKRLITDYAKHLALYQEIDNYLTYRHLSLQQILNRISFFLTQINKSRQSRRFSIDLPMHYFLLKSKEALPGTLLNISLHGGALRSQQSHLFHLHEQLVLRIPLSQFLKIEGSDFLRLSAKIRHVFMAGDPAGFSFEHVNETQFMNLSEFIINFMNRKILKP